MILLIHTIKKRKNLTKSFNNCLVIGDILFPLNKSCRFGSSIILGALSFNARLARLVLGLNNLCLNAASLILVAQWSELTAEFFEKDSLNASGIHYYYFALEINSWWLPTLWIRNKLRSGDKHVGDHHLKATDLEFFCALIKITEVIYPSYEIVMVLRIGIEMHHYKYYYHDEYQHYIYNIHRYIRCSFAVFFTSPQLNWSDPNLCSNHFHWGDLIWLRVG